MKVCLKKEVSGSHEQCTGPTVKAKFKKKKRKTQRWGLKAIFKQVLSYSFILIM